MLEILVCSPFVTFGGVERIILNRVHALAAVGLPIHLNVFFSANYGADIAFRNYLARYGVEQNRGRIDQRCLPA